MISTATRELALLQARELVRDRRYFYFALVFPFGMLGIFALISTVIPKKAGAPDFMRFVIPMALFLAVTSSALTVTAGPLAGMRSKGTLRLLGTTPIGRARLIYTHMAARVVMVTGQAAALLALAVALGSVKVGEVPAMFGITLLGLALFGAIGYLIGGRLAAPDAATNIGTLVQLGALFMSGLTFPLSLMPGTVATVLSLLPTTFFADLMLTRMPSGQPRHSVWSSILVVTATTVAVAFLAVRTFRWDQGDD